jgi:di/tripeptidase
MIDSAVQDLLKSSEMKKMLEDVGKEIAAETESDYSYPAAEYKYEVDVVETKTRAVARVGTDTERAIYSEAKHGFLQINANKRRA